ncbi:MAG: NAD-dependent succinate-semialdehyde dehydrogenase [Sphingomonadales bacterium]|nr:NAD-dependent succinate-semialdehyde dehydrogenase [Sphingomonadales bacterium]
MRIQSVSINPANGMEIASYPAMDSFELEAAVAEADAGYQVWRSLAVSTRARLLDQLGETLKAKRDLLGAMMTAEMGKPISAALGEVDKCVNLCAWYAANLERLLASEISELGTDGVATVRYLPLGVVLGVMPWNFPIWQVLRAAVPIMAAGNGFVLKHADNVQGSALALGECFAAAGFPAGSFTVVNASRDAIAGLLSDRRICGVSVTAGVAAGAALAAEAGRNLKKSLLELGGSDPFIVLADADLDRAVSAAVTARFQNCGQVCIAAKRIIVERPIADEFTQRFVAEVSKIKVGDPEDPATEMGPMARERLRAEVHDLVQASVAKGARILTGGFIPEGRGTFYPPTVLVDVTNDMPICREETFGPVAPILVARDAEHAVSLANDSDFGLSSALWTRNTSRAANLATRIEAGAVYINGFSASDPRVPIGGIKNSGYGRELSHFGLKEFCNVQLHWARSG